MLKLAKFGFSLFGINTYVVYDEKACKAAVIDPGMIEEREEEALMGFINKHNLTVTHIINTHLHVDHAIGAAFAKDKFKAPLFAHKDDEFLGAQLPDQLRMFGISRAAEEVSIDSYLEDGEEIKIGDGTLKVLLVPGHSPGSVALYCPESKFVITGDALFAGSIGRTDLPGGNGPQLVRSIKEKLIALPDDTMVFPGHGPATTIGSERHSNPFLKEY